MTPSLSYQPCLTPCLTPSLSLTLRQGTWGINKRIANRDLETAEGAAKEVCLGMRGRRRWKRGNRSLSPSPEEPESNQMKAGDKTEVNKRWCFPQHAPELWVPTTAKANCISKWKFMEEDCLNNLNKKHHKVLGISLLTARKTFWGNSTMGPSGWLCMANLVWIVCEGIGEEIRKKPHSLSASLFHCLHLQSEDLNGSESAKAVDMANGFVPQQPIGRQHVPFSSVLARNKLCSCPSETGQPQHILHPAL